MRFRFDSEIPNFAIQTLNVSRFDSETLHLDIQSLNPEVQPQQVASECAGGDASDVAGGPFDSENLEPQHSNPQPDSSIPGFNLNRWRHR